MFRIFEFISHRTTLSRRWSLSSPDVNPDDDLFLQKKKEISESSCNKNVRQKHKLFSYTFNN